MAAAETHPLYRTDINHKDWQSSFSILIFKYISMNQDMERY